jgi:murein DD-endopeptidase MepM/ murein hydrolase activator NlpD
MTAKRAFESCINCLNRVSGALRCSASSMGSAFGVTGAGFEFTLRSLAMQIMITHGTLARTRVMQLSRFQIVLGFVALLLAMTLLSGTVYHVVFLKAAREGWPVVSQIVNLVVRDEFAQRDRFMRENLDAMAQKVGEMQAKLIQLEAVGERVAGAAGVKPEELRQMMKPVRSAQGGPFVPARTPSLDTLTNLVGTLDLQADQHADMFTLFEARLFESRMQAMMVPNSRPVDAAQGSGFGFRTDPFSGHVALHTGLDFPADVGTPVMAAAAGVVSLSEVHPAYGNVIELDHGKGLITRYAHNSKVLVKIGDLVKRSQAIAEVGSSGRSTGPHLHFEVRIDGVAQDPAKFLAAGNATGDDSVASAKSARSRR